ncbi:uncharacterized protein LOC103854410 isoform X2 [Brassica rapa]|uniref:uncharacterized protein LOC111209357 n=1 Tax=Brassica napus TaxID=3708 RepID=UPI000BBF130B|nr:uncharacterized protein LOC111209357 [Brassica napus]XP_033137934.1 uncharacterized protein LOC103854410 isoform X2 [Brassica rapa]
MSLKISVVYRIKDEQATPQPLQRTWEVGGLLDWYSVARQMRCKGIGKRGKPCLKLLLKLRLSSFQVFITNSRSFSHSSSPKLTLFLVSGSQAQALSKFTLSMAIDTWKPEETRYFFELYAEERRKGNKVGTSMNKVGKANIMEAFEQRFKNNFPDWRPYKSKYDTSRKKYIKIKTLAQNRTGLGFDDMGRINMSDDWWSERERECHGIRRSVCKEISNMDMFEAEFGGVVVIGPEGWSAQHGEASLNSRVAEDDGDDEADSQPAAETQTLET